MSPRRGQSRANWPIALLAMLALFVQALIPAASMAHEMGPTVVICTAQGAETIQIDDAVHGDHDVQKDSKSKGFGGLPCAQCVAVSLATTTPPDIAVAPVLYSVRVAPAPILALTGVALARAPPRPPSQGPPAAPIA